MATHNLIARLMRSASLVRLQAIRLRRRSGERHVAPPNIQRRAAGIHLRRELKYRPANYGGGFSMRDVPMRTGLIKSLNVVTVDVAMQTGLAKVANTAQRFGLPRPKPYPALALGTTEATPLQLAAAYAAFANGGRNIQPKVIADPDQAPQGDQTDRQIIQPASAYVITDMLEGVIDHGTAHAARGAIKNTAVAGKTGTSRDGWFVATRRTWYARFGLALTTTNSWG